MALKQAYRTRWKRWLDRRIPPASQVQLSHRSIFILPTRTGFLFLLLLLLLLVTAINYQNSLIYGLTFWLFSVGLSAMLFTFRNLAGLTLGAGHSTPVFAGETVGLPVRLTAQKSRWHEALEIGFPQNTQVVDDACDSQVSKTLTLSFKTAKRGWLNPGRLRLDSRFPLGLFNAWTWVALDFKGLVYPKPEYVPFVFAAGESGEHLAGAPSLESGQQDFQGLRPYQAGDSLKRIAWKQLARGKGLVSKDFDHDEGATCWLDWEVLAPMPVETRLSRLTGWVLQAHQRNWRYGLRLPGVQLAPDNSEIHRDQCLKALALYGMDDGNRDSHTGARA
ncbi:DUF58 domain-containing protein [Thalassolituus sp. LLYu03]|uniref:DUF58 domain-containing protein n=1 Tax=Thalassolituus sp. LLYu03 TaxID=3421656 RepID=UPI003D2880A6